MVGAVGKISFSEPRSYRKLMDEQVEEQMAQKEVFMIIILNLLSITSAMGLV